LTVNSTGDASDANTGDSACATAGGVCTLRAALEQTQVLGGTNTIGFLLANPRPRSAASSEPGAARSGEGE